MGGRHREHPGGVGEARGGRLRDRSERIVEPGDLPGARPAPRLVRAREVAHRMERPRHPGQGGKLAPGLGEVGRREPEPVHPGVDLDPHPHRRAGGAGAEQRDLLGGVHHRVHPLRGEPVERFAVPEPAENEEGPPDPRPPQGERLVRPGHRKPIRGRERPRGPHRAVAIGVGLDHREHPAPARPGADDTQVVGERGAVDTGGRSGRASGGRPPRGGGHRCVTDPVRSSRTSRSGRGRRGGRCRSDRSAACR